MKISKLTGEARTLREVDEAILRTIARTLTGNARTDEMERLYRHEGWTLERIGVKFGVTRERVRQLLKPRGITMRDRKGFGGRLKHMPAEQRKTIVTMLAAHWRSDDVARHLKIPNWLVADVWKDHRQALREERLERAKKLYVKYKSARKVGDIMGVSDQCVLQWLRGTGLIVSSKERGYPKSIRVRAMKLKRQGRSSSDVAQIVGCSEKTVQVWWNAENGRPRIRDRHDAAEAQHRYRLTSRQKRLETKRVRMAKAAAQAAPDLVHVAAKTLPSHEH